MELKIGYKKTEIGIIPDSWEVTKLGDAVDFLDGRRRPVKIGDRARMQGEFPYYGASGIVDYVNDYIFDDDLILLGEDGENILSRATRLAFRVSGKIWVNNHAHVLKPKSNFSIGYLTDYLESLDYSLMNSGTAQPKLNKRTCESLLIAKPSFAEQTAIANALSDADALIGSLQKLIAKKRQIKQGAMQTLLNPFKSGVRNKSGYKDTEIGMIPISWEVKALKNVAPLQRGFDLTNFQLSNGVHPVVYSNGILNYHNQAQVKGPGVVTGRSGTIGKVNYIERDFWPHNTTLWVTDFKGNNPKFIYYLFCDVRLERFGTGSGVPTLNRNDVHDTLIALPPVNEQERIANILSDIDTEISALETKLTKYQKIKQGMMQNLLTGRIRLA